MAVPIIQLTPVDPSLQSNPDFGNMTEYIISGTYYIVDNLAQIVYEFAQNTPGNLLINSGGSYVQFQAFLIANGPPTQQTNTANYPTVVTPQQEYIYLLRGMYTALVNMATSGGGSSPLDYYPLPSVT